uniref:NAD-dependent epimerase/dehydratase domain-containing protein n=1 Tax=Chaetoceros debilis TaxID=122233 RepID=A0A7S3PV73_9STRA
MRNFLASVAITYYFNAISFVQSFSVEAPAPAPKDIAIVGCGVLGTSLLRQLVTSPEFESKSITAITKTSNNHESILKSVGSSSESSSFDLTTMDEIPKDQKFSNVVFCAPPSAFDDYPAAVADASDNLWCGTNDGDGTFVFTSSGGVYGPGDGEVVSETSPLPDSSLASARSMRMVKAEENVLSRKGGVLRLAGLYTLERGAHNYWLEKGDGTVKGSSDGIINLLNYDDAAGACLSALKVGPSIVGGKVFLISDGHPTTREGICASALKSKKYKDSKMPTFGQSDGAGKGKIYDGNISNLSLKWEPVHESFDKFMQGSQ